MSNNNQQLTEVQKMQARIAELEAQLAKNNQPKAVTFGIGEDKGAIGIYGINTTFPLTVYSEQMPRLIEALTGKPLADDAPISVFMKKHSALLALKAEKDTPASENKRLLRVADTTGAVKHPTEANIAKFGKNNGK